MNSTLNFVSNFGLVMLLNSDMVLMSRFDFLTMLSWLILMTLLNFSKKIIIKYDFAVLSFALFTIFWFVVWSVRLKTKPFRFSVPHCILALVFYSLKKREKHRGKKPQRTYGYYGDETQIFVFHCRGCHHQEMFTVISLSTLIAIC